MSATLQSIATEGWWGGGTALPMPTAPVLIATAQGPTSVLLSWDFCAYAQHYLVYYRLVGATSWTQFGTTHNGPTCTIVGLVEASAYEFKVAVVNPSAPAGVDSNIAGASTTASAVAPVEIAAPFDFYLLAISGDGVAVETLQYEDVYGQLEVNNIMSMDGQEFGQYVKNYFFIPDGIMTGIAEGQIAKDINDTRLRIIAVETFDDHQEITMRRINP